MVWSHLVDCSCVPVSKQEEYMCHMFFICGVFICHPILMIDSCKISLCIMQQILYVTHTIFSVVEMVPIP
jgi:hypothetical protein